jgi:hypothetical protein
VVGYRNYCRWWRACGRARVSAVIVVVVSGRWRLVADGDRARGLVLAA